LATAEVLDPVIVILPDVLVMALAAFILMPKLLLPPPAAVLPVTLISPEALTIVPPEIDTP
jgi:hypothetical protein